MRISDSGRYFTDYDSKPVFWLGDTQWQLFRSFSLDDAEMTLRNRKRHGFSFIQVMLLGVNIEPNLDGEEPFTDSDPLRPNERYFRHIDSVLERAADIGGVTLVIGIYHKGYAEDCFTEKNAREWARWLASRYRHIPCIIWSMYPAASPEYIPICRELASGLVVGDGGAHLITVHPDPSPATSAALFHDEPWLACNSIQTFKDVELIFPMTTEDYRRTPTKPVVMAEGAYEAGIEYGFDITPLWVRRQAYYSYFAGGHHSYGHNDSWRLNPTWREALDAPGAVQMGVLKKTLESLPEWWTLTPDNSLLASGRRCEGAILTLAARHVSDTWAAVYTGAPAEFVLDLERLDGSEYDTRWIDPRNGATVTSDRVAADGARTFRLPDGLEDGIFILRKDS